MRDSPPDFHTLNPMFTLQIQSYWNALNDVENVSDEEVLSAKRSLVKFAFRRIFQSLYLKVHPKIKGDIFFVSHVHADGVGDYYALLKSARAYRKRVSNGIYIHVAYRYQKPLPQIALEDYGLVKERVHGFYEPTDYQLLAKIFAGETDIPMEARLRELEEERGVLEGAPPSFTDSLDKEIEKFKTILVQKKRAIAVYEAMKNSLAVVHIALAINTFDNPVLAGKSLYFAEAGNFQGVSDYLNRNWHGMGLDPFEDGLFLGRYATITDGWCDKTLEKLIEGKNDSVNLCYQTRSASQQLAFIYLTVLLQKSSKKTLSIVFPKLLVDTQSCIDVQWLNKQGVGVLEIWQATGAIVIQTGFEGGKKLRILAYPNIPAGDFERLIALSDEVVGCTGDQSLSECLAAKKVPYYEMCSHKTDVWNGLIEIAKFLESNLVLDYLTMLSIPVENAIDIAEKLAKIFLGEGFLEEWDAVVNFLHQHYCFEDALTASLNRFLILQEKPAQEALENDLAEQWFRGDISIDDAVKKLL